MTLVSQKLFKLNKPDMQNTELVSDSLLWTPSHGQIKAGQPARTYIQQLCANTGCSLEDLPRAMVNRNGCRERFREIYAGGTT